jgi:hypothetical protein
MAGANVPRHQFSADLMSLCMNMVFGGAISLRATAKVLRILVPFLPDVDRVPCANTIRLWALRLGLFELQRRKKADDDWAWIMDHTVQLGPWKCLVIVGVRLSHWRQKQAPLEHTDLTLLNLTPMEHSTGEAVAEQLEATRAELGVMPAMVVSDEGAELKSGMELFRQRACDGEGAPHVFDIKHKMATLLKKELHHDKRWNSFVMQTYRTKMQVTLTDLAFLVPPGLKNKARYMNLGALVQWGERVLAFLDHPRDFPGQAVDRSKLRKKLGWLKRYRRVLAQWAELLEIAACVESYVRQEGYHPQAAAEMETRLAPLARSAAGLRVASRLQTFLAEQGAKSTSGTRLLGSSEALESLLGKYKHIQGTHAAGGMTAALLNIGSVVHTKVADALRAAMVAQPVRTVAQWVRRNLGITIPAQQALAFAKNKTGTKIAPAVT